MSEYRNARAVSGAVAAAPPTMVEALAAAAAAGSCWLVLLELVALCHAVVCRDEWKKLNIAPRKSTPLTSRKYSNSIEAPFPL